jgi:hypothetical protein
MLGVGDWYHGNPRMGAGGLGITLMFHLTFVFMYTIMSLVVEGSTDGHNPRLYGRRTLASG